MAVARPRIAIATGDPAGVGPEISLKAALDPGVRALCRPVVIGDRGVLEAHAKPCGLSLEGVELVERNQFKPGELRMGEIDAAHGRATLDSAETAIRGTLAGDYAAVVAAPHTESAIHAAGVSFDGYPSFVARVTGHTAEEAILMLCFRHEQREVRIAHVTLHSSVARALQLITRESVARTIRAVHEALRRLGIAAPRIGVSGVNPHAGEGGLFGDEEQRVVAPAIDDARRGGIAAEGPMGADTLIQRPGYDAYVVMFHDQGHVAAKLLAPNRAAALTIGLPVLFSSVGHGSALDIAGQNRASPAALIEAIHRVTPSRTLPFQS